MNFNNINHLVVNSFRRTLLSGLSNYAFDNFEVILNTSLIDDDQLIHRFAMIPIKCNENLSIHFKYKNDTNKNVEITTDFFKDFAVEKDNKKYKIYKNILICILQPDEEIDLILNTNISNGKENAKYSHVYDLFFEQEIGILFNNNLLDKNDVLELDSEEIQERLPYLFNDENKLIIKKLYIDTNIIQNLNEILDKKCFEIKDFENYTLNFETFFNENKKVIFNQCIDLLINNILNLKVIENKLYCEYSISNLILFYYRKNFSTIFSIYKNHPLDVFMILKTEDDFNLNKIKTIIQTELFNFKL